MPATTDVGDTTPSEGLDDLSAVYINCTLKPSPKPSHTNLLVRRSVGLMRSRVTVTTIRAVDHDIAPGVYPDMTEHGFEQDDSPAIQEQVMAANILVLASPIWLGEKSSVCTRVMERLSTSHGCSRSCPGSLPSGRRPSRSRRWRRTSSRASRHAAW